jgi:hypothetical protein
MNIDDDGKLKRRFTNKRVNAAKEGIGFLLTWDQFCGLLEDAGIQSSQLGITGYHLARNGDSGNYEVGNCRFITHKENYAERVESDAVREARKRNCKIMQEKRAAYPIEVRRSWSQNRRGWDYDRETLEKTGVLADRMRLVAESGIEIDSFGGLTKAARLLGVSHTHMRRMLKRFEQLTA